MLFVFDRMWLSYVLLTILLRDKYIHLKAFSFIKNPIN